MTRGRCAAMEARLQHAHTRQISCKSSSAEVFCCASLQTCCFPAPICSRSHDARVLNTHGEVQFIVRPYIKINFRNISSSSRKGPWSWDNVAVDEAWAWNNFVWEPVKRDRGFQSKFRPNFNQNEANLPTGLSIRPARERQLLQIVVLQSSLHSKRKGME